MQARVHWPTPSPPTPPSNTSTSARATPAVAAAPLSLARWYDTLSCRFVPLPLQAATPDIQQMIAALLLVKGLGKAEADGALSWQIVGTEAGALTVNGVDLSKMLGGGQ